MGKTMDDGRTHMPEKQIIECVGILKLKLGACVSGPTARMVADLKEVAQLCNRSKNHMVREWERWREDHPDWEAGIVTTKRGKERMEHPCLSYPCEEHLYESARRKFNQIAGIIMSTLRSEVVSRLKSKLPYNHDGPSRFRWQGILNYEVSRDCYRSQVIPVPNGSSVLCYDGACSRELSPGIMARVRKHQAACVIRFPLWSESSGRANQDVIVRLEVADLSRGNRRVMKRIAAGEWKMSDSELVCRDGTWFLHLTYKQPQKDFGLDPAYTATLLLPSDAKSPLLIECACKQWGLGHIANLERELARYNLRLSTLRERYRKDVRGKPGHGRGYFYEKTRPASDLKRNLLENFARGMIAEVVKFCLRFDCGKLVYREPSLNLRGLSWFAACRIEFGWDRFRANLEHKCKLYGIEFVVERMGCAEFRARAEVVEKPGTARVEQNGSSNGHANGQSNGAKKDEAGNGYRSQSGASAPKKKRRKR